MSLLLQLRGCAHNNDGRTATRNGMSELHSSCNSNLCIDGAVAATGIQRRLGYGIPPECPGISLFALSMATRLAEHAVLEWKGSQPVFPAKESCEPGLDNHLPTCTQEGSDWRAGQA